MARRRKRDAGARGPRDMFTVDVKDDGAGGVVVARIRDPAAFVASRSCRLSGDVVDMVASFVADLALPPDDGTDGGDA